MKTRTPSFSKTCKTEIVCSNDTNPMGFLLGGKLVQWMDIAAAVTAQTHAENICLTASINSVNFLSSARLGDIVRISAKITRVFNTSMEIIVDAVSTNVQSHRSIAIASAFFTFVALDDHGKVTAIPPITPSTLEEKRLYRSAANRKKKI
jgi:acyl-CoA hydrolase